MEEKRLVRKAAAVSEESVWKVCRAHRDKYVSCFAKESSKLIYQEGTWTEAPEGTKLFAFRDYQSAAGFVRLYGDEHLVLLKAIAQGVSRPPLAILYNVLTWKRSTMKAFWSGKRIPESELRPTPPGTVLCDRLKLSS